VAYVISYIYRVPRACEKKLADAGHDERHRKRLLNAAEGWLFLADQLRRLEKSFEDGGVEKALRSRPDSVDDNGEIIERLRWRPGLLDEREG
jgi:hypothetical protein